VAASQFTERECGRICASVFQLSLYAETHGLSLVYVFFEEQGQTFRSMGLGRQDRREAVSFERETPLKNTIKKAE
jgi:hypothetical protein